jgi:D-ribose pyranase
MCVEKAYVSKGILAYSLQVLELIQDVLGDVSVEQIPHPDFKERAGKSRAVIRTGEFTPYTNVILVSGPWGFDL